MSKLSNINTTPSYVTIQPSTGVKIKFRPFLVKEERALLTASESEDVDTMYTSLEAVVNNCLQSDVKDLTTFDLEYLFIKIRSKSVGETSDVVITCHECSKESIQTINLDSVEVENMNKSKKIELSDKITVLMQYPTTSELLSIDTRLTAEEAKLNLIKLCTHSVYHEDDIYVLKEEPKEEIDKFFDNLLPDQYHKLKDFVDTIPFTQIKHAWECPTCKHKNNSILKGIYSFF
jgi:hypothetical protein